MRTKPVATVAIVGAIMLALAACGSSSNSSSGSSSSASTTASAPKKYNVTLSLGVQGCPFCIAVQRGAEAAAQKYGVNFKTVAPPKADVNQQIQQLNGVIANKPDGLLIQPDDGQAIAATMQQFAAAKVPAITVDTDSNNPSLRLGTVTSNNLAGGKLAADQINKITGGKGQVAYIGYVPGASTTDQRQKGFEAELKKFPGLQYVGAQFTQDDTTEAATKMSALLKRYPHLAAVFGGDEANAIGTGTALRQAGLAGKVKLVAFDGAPDEVQALKQGQASMLIVQNAYQIGYSGMQQLYNYLANKTQPAKLTNPGYVVVTKANVDDPKVQKFLYPNS
jgi:ribose transport system substrate-binding protein